MTPTPEDQARIRRYLLGQLDEDAREELEQQLLVNDELFEELSVSEDELVDEYVHNTLSAGDRSDFERYFLTSPERHEKLTFGSALDRYLSRETPGPAPVVPVPKPSWITRAVIAVVVVGLLAGTFWVYRSRTAEPHTFATLTLNSTQLTRGEPGSGKIEKITLPLNEDALRLVLKLPQVSAPVAGYRAELVDGASRTTILQVPDYDSETATAIVLRDSLVRGQYVVRLYAIRPDKSEQRTDGSYVFIVE